MANPQVAQGTLNRVRGSIVYADNPSLNITAPYLDAAGISMAFDNNAGVLLPTLTGGVTSPEPYQMCTLTVHILKTQGLASTYKTQFETLVNVGDFQVITDAATLPNYSLSNGVLLGIQELGFNGSQAGFVFRLQGIYYVNASLFDLV
jgi:hypothetical protein